MGRFYENHPSSESIHKARGLGSPTEPSVVKTQEVAESPSEVFTLRPLTRRRVTARVRRRSVARFHFVSEED